MDLEQRRSEDRREEGSSSEQSAGGKLWRSLWWSWVWISIDRVTAGHGLRVQRRHQQQQQVGERWGWGRACVFVCRDGGR